MQGDLLLQEWKQAKDTCKKIIEICKRSHLGTGEVEGRILGPGEKQTKKQFINVYDVVYRLCLTKEKEENRVLMVYRDYKDLLKTALLEMAPLLNYEKDVYRLGALRKLWEAYADMQRRLNNMFAYLNRPYHLKNDKIEDLDRTSTNLIAGTLFGEGSVQEYEAIYFKELDKIRKRRDPSHCKLLADTVDIFYQIHCRVLKHISNKKARTIFTQFYSQYQKVAREYYHRKFEVLKELSPSQYFNEVSNLYQHEKEIADTCFVFTSDTLINKEFSEELILAYKEILLNSAYGLKHILRTGQTPTLKLIVDLHLKLTKSVEGFKEQFEEYILEEMKNFIDEAKVDITPKKYVVNCCAFVERLIRKNQELISVLESIAAVGDFVPYYKSGVEKAVVQAKTAVPIEELLAVYVDTKFRIEMEEGEFEQEVKNVITIFNCLHNKDLFLLKYTQRFGKRILQINEASLANHELFIANLKINCGAKYTESLQTIVTEYRISHDLQPQLAAITQQHQLPISLTLKVFSEGAWPTQSLLELPLQFLPRELQQADHCITLYKNQFLSKKVLKISALQSKVRWMYYFAEETKPSKPNCYFDTNCLQAALLEYIYRQRPHKVALKMLEQLLAKTTPKLLKQNLDKLSEGSENLLMRWGEGEDIVYEFNPLMKSSKKLISFEQGSSQEEEKLFYSHDLGRDREIVIDANVSKIMKAKKVLDFKSLIEETIRIIRVFVPHAKDVKEAIDRLIAKEILQRDQKDREMIRYRD